MFTNFPELCRAMNRGQEHCMAFLLAVTTILARQLDWVHAILGLQVAH